MSITINCKQADIIIFALFRSAQIPSELDEWLKATNDVYKILIYLDDYYCYGY